MQLGASSTFPLSLGFPQRYFPVAGFVYLLYCALGFPFSYRLQQRRQHRRGASLSQAFSARRTSVAQQSPEVREEVLAGVHPTPPQTPQPSTQHTSKDVDCTPSSPLLHTAPGTKGTKKQETRQGRQAYEKEEANREGQRASACRRYVFLVAPRKADKRLQCAPSRRCVDWILATGRYVYEDKKGDGTWRREVAVKTHIKKANLQGSWCS